MTRLLWVSNPPWSGSGYGQQTALFASRLKQLGLDVAIGANYGLEGSVFEWQGLTVYPADREWSNRSVVKVAEHHEADLVVFLCDAWVLDPKQWADELGVPVAIWAPVDHAPIPPAVFGVLDDERISPVAMSRFGSEQMKGVQLEHHYVPHGIDLSTFSPRRETRDAIRDELGIDRETFLVGMVAANQGSPHRPRKGFPEAFQAFSAFARAHDDARLYVHAVKNPPAGSGINLETCSVMAGVPAGRISFPDAGVHALGMAPDVVSHLYQVFDVLLAPSYGEGFGIPVLEAQACGVPVIVSNFSAQPELCGAGWMVDGQPQWDAPSNAWFFMPAIESIRLQLELAYEARDDLGLRARAREFSLQYDANRVTFDYWLPVLGELGADVAGALERILVTPGESRQARRARERSERKAAVRP